MSPDTGRPDEAATASDEAATASDPTVTTAVVLAGGEGRRLRPLTANRPKPMLPAGDRPILEHVFDGLIDAGIEEIAVVIGYRGDRVQNYFGPTYRDVDLRYLRQEKRLGSGHALLQARDAVADPFVVANGDQLVDPGLIDDVISAHADGETLGTLGVVRTEQATHYGAVELAGETVVDLIERPGDTDHELLNAGVYAFEPAFFAVLERAPREDGSLTLPGAVTRVVQDDDLSVRGVRTEGFWTDATYPWDLLDASQQVMARGWIDEPAVDDDRWIAETARVHPTATLRGPVVIGPDAVVGPGAVVGPNAVLGRNVTVESNAVLRNALLDDDTRVSPNATLVDCVTGQGVRVGAGVTAGGGPADVRIGTSVYEDRRLGAVVADRARVGSGGVLSPGVLVGQGARVHDGTRVRTNVAADQEVR